MVDLFRNVLSENSRKVLFAKLKKTMNTRTIAEKVGVSEHTVRTWTGVESTIPKSCFAKLKEYIPRLNLKYQAGDAFWGQATNRKNKPVLTPTMDEEFAEFYGALLGDGCIYSSGKTICLTGNAGLDDEYISMHLKNISERIFGTSVRLKKGPPYIRMYIDSSKLCALKNSGSRLV
jgi:hypothetical protein